MNANDLDRHITGNYGEDQIRPQTIKTIRSHAGLARFLASVREAGVVPRQSRVPSPYSSGPSVMSYWYKGQRVSVYETYHRHYEVVLVD